jgi:hypothetical protein
MNEDIVNAGYDAQSPEVNPDITTPAPQPSQSENPAVSSDQQPEPDPAQVLWQSLQQDPIGTIAFLAQHYGWQPNMYPNQPGMLPNTPPALSNPNPAPMQQQLDPWQELIANVALRMWQSEAASIVKQRAQEDGLELSDQDLQSIFLTALEKYAGDIDSAYAAFAYPRLKARASQKQQSTEEKEPESGDLMSSIIMAGYR